MDEPEIKNNVSYDDALNYIEALSCTDALQSRADDALNNIDNNASIIYKLFENILTII